MTPRQFIFLMNSLLLVSAIGVGVFVGGAWDLFDRIAGLMEWLIGVGLTLTGVAVLLLFNFVCAGIVSFVLGWALGETGVAAIKTLGYALVAWLGAVMLVAVTWAWLGHGSTWREMPRQWLFAASVLQPDDRVVIA